LSSIFVSEGNTVLGENLSGFDDGTQVQDIVRVQHDIEHRLDFGDQRHVCDRIPFLNRVEGERLGHAARVDPKRLGECAMQFCVVGHDR